MHTPPEDEPGAMPLAIARARARTMSPLAAASAKPVETVDGADADGSNGHRSLLEQIGRPRFRWPRPRFKWPRLSGPWLRRAILVAWPVGLAAAGVVLYLCYLAVSRTEEVTSDGASIALQAWAMLHGNPLLRGWTVTDVSFYTTELPEYMIVEWVRGLNADVLHASAAITYTLVVLTGGLLGRGRAKGREGMVRMLIAAGIMVAPQLGAGVFILIFQPDHIGSSVPLMLTWLVLDRTPRSWYVPPIIALMLAWGAIGDQLILLIGVAPLAAVSAVRAYQILVQRREGWRSGWFDVSLVVAAAAAAEISRIVVREISAHGGYNVLPVPGGVAPITDMSSHLWLLVQSICGLYGADLFGMTSIGLNAAIALLHLVGLALAAWGLWLVIRRFFSCEDRIAQILTVGILINLAAYMLSTTPTTYWSAREVAPVLPMGAVLAARMLGGQAEEGPAGAGPERGPGLLPGGARLHGRAAGHPGRHPEPRGLACRKPSDLRPEQLRDIQHHHAGQRRDRQRAPGELGRQLRRGRPLRVRQILVRPHPPLRELRRADQPAHPDRPDRALGGAGLVREAAAHLSLQPLHHHDLQQEPAARPRPVTAPAAPAAPGLTRPRPRQPAGRRPTAMDHFYAERNVPRAAANPARSADHISVTADQWP